MTEQSRGEQLRKNDFEELRSGQLENRKIIEKYQDGSLRSVKKIIIKMCMINYVYAPKDVYIG